MSDSEQQLPGPGTSLPNDSMTTAANEPFSSSPSEKEAEANIPKSTTAPPHQTSAPDGGLEAWLQVAGAFSVFFNTWGFLNTFGVFQNYYEEGTLFKQSSSNIAWIGAVQAYLLISMGVISGPLYDRGYLRHLLAVGSFLLVFSIMMLSICKTYWQVVLAQGFCFGIGAGLIFIPALAALPPYFNRRLGLAMGLAASGSSLGGVIYPIVFYRLLSRIGFGWSTRVMGFMALATLVVPMFFLKMRVKPAKPRDVIDYTAFTDWPFAMVTVATMVGFVGLYVMFTYLSYYSGAEHIASAEMSFYVVPILNAASIFGRTLPNAISDITGPMNLYGPASACCAILVFCMLAAKSLGGVVAIAILWGFFSGVYIALPPVAFVRLTADKSKVGTRIGMGFAMCGFGILAGGPGGGKVLGTANWSHLWIYGGVFAIASAFMLIALRFYLTKGKLVAKV